MLDKIIRFERKHFSNPVVYQAFSIIAIFALLALIGILDLARG